MTGAIKTFQQLPHAKRGSAPYSPRGEGEGREVPLVGVVRNARSHRNKDREPEDAAAAQIITETTLKRKELAGVLDRFAREGVDFLAVDGGDGTVRDVLTSGEAIFGESWPPLIVLPKGKTNALAADLGLPGDWNLAHAIERAKAGSFVTRRTLVVADATYPEARVQGFLLGAGLFTRATSLGQSAHRLGAFNAVAVGLTTLWTLIQAIFAGRHNLWRRNTPMWIANEQGQPIAGEKAERYMMLASTLENFPMGLRPFGEARSGLKLTLLDSARRRSLLRVPAIAFGRLPRKPEKLGYHWLQPKSFRFTIRDRFILDGEAFPSGDYRVFEGPEFRFVVP